MLKEQDIPAPSDPSTGSAPRAKIGDAGETASGGPRWLARLKSLLAPKLIVTIVVGTVIVQAMLLGYYRLAGGATADAEAVSGGEVTLGQFQFEASPHEVGRVQAARFQLHLALLPDIDEVARLRLKQRQFRVQQDIEQLMRQAHSGDFNDPPLTELKRQLQEQVNETLGIRAVSEVIITDLELEQSPVPESHAETAAQPRNTAPWSEHPGEG